MGEWALKNFLFYHLRRMTVKWSNHNFPIDNVRYRTIIPSCIHVWIVCVFKNYMWIPGFGAAEYSKPNCRHFPQFLFFFSNYSQKSSTFISCHNNAKCYFDNCVAHMYRQCVRFFFFLPNEGRCDSLSLCLQYAYCIIAYYFELSSHRMENWDDGLLYGMTSRAIGSLCYCNEVA